MNIDIETRSDVELAKAGVYRYVESDAFAILLIGYCVDGGPVNVLDLTTIEMPEKRNDAPEEWNELRRILTDPAYIKHAYNAEFEWVCLQKHTGKRTTEDHTISDSCLLLFHIR